MMTTAPPRASDAPGRTGLIPQEPQDRPHRHRCHRAAEIMVPGQLVAQAIRQRQHPLPHRHIGEHVVDQVCRPFGHPAPRRSRRPCGVCTTAEGDARCRTIRIATERNRPPTAPTARSPETRARRSGAFRRHRGRARPARGRSRDGRAPPRTARAAPGHAGHTRKMARPPRAHAQDAYRSGIQSDRDETPERYDCSDIPTHRSDGRFTDRGPHRHLRNHPLRHDVRVCLSIESDKFPTKSA